MSKTFLLVGLMAVVGWGWRPLVAEEIATPPMLSAAELGTTNAVHTFDTTLLAGQPSAADLALAAKQGTKTVITLRGENEIDWDESAAVKELGLTFHRFAIRSPETLTNDIFEQTLQLLNDKKTGPVLLHCASANRVGAIWLAHRVVNDGIPIKTATEEAKLVGLKSPGLEARALAYIEQRANADDEPSVKPGINDLFLDPKLDVSEWLARFEIESREVYAARERVLDAVEIKPGQTVADIGAGTGFYSRLFASVAGESGWVYAVDIAPNFLEHINKQARADKVDNITSVLGTDRSICLPTRSVDVAFICDTYHHFEFPQSTLESIHRALKPGGRLILIDFERIPGESREWTIGHVRAGKDVFRKEIEEAGFRFVDEVKIPTFQENYLLRFTKQAVRQEPQ